MKDDSDSEKQQQIHHIKNLYAFNLFCQKRFDESMQVFAKLGTGNTQVWWRRGVIQACLCMSIVVTLVRQDDRHKSGASVLCVIKS